MLEVRLLPPLVAFEVNLVLAVFALLKFRRGPDQLYYFWFALGASAWSLGMALYYFMPAGMEDLPLRAAFAAGAAVPAVFLAYCRARAGKRTRSYFLIGMGTAAVLAVLAANLDLARLFGLRLSNAAMAAQIIAVACYFAAAYLAGFAALIPGLRARPPDPDLRFIVLSQAVPFVLIFAYTLLVWAAPALPRPNVLLPVMVGAELLLYHGVRSGRMGAEELLAHGVLYLVYTIVITGVAFLLLFGLGRIAGAQVSAWQLAGLIACCLAAAFGFAAGRARIQAWVDREFFPEKFEYQRRLRSYEAELSAARERLHRAERLAVLGELSAKVAHEIKNPLAPIKGYARLLADASRSGELNPALLEKGLRIIGEESDRIDERVRGFLDLARRGPRRREDTDLHELIERTAALVENKPSLTVRPDFQAKDPVARVDPDQVQGALYNILRNAAEAMNGAGEIEVGTANDGAFILITIRDRGPGITPSDLASIFDPFISGKPGGAGLGLAIAKSVIEAHGGRIEAESAEGSGAEFRVWVPRGREEKSMEPRMDAD